VRRQIGLWLCDLCSQWAWCPAPCVMVGWSEFGAGRSSDGGFAPSDAGWLTSCVGELPRYDRLQCKPVENGVLAFGVLYMELRGMGVQRAACMVIVDVPVVATCADLVCAECEAESYL
jgi:hypothetical protein